MIFDSLLKNIKQIQKIGANKVGIIDMSNISQEKNITKIYLSKETVSNLDIINEENYLELESGNEQSYFVASAIQLQKSTEIPVDDNDRIKPGKACKLLAQNAKKYIFQDFNLSPVHLCKYAESQGFRKSNDKSTYNNLYCKWDDQAEQWFYRDAFLRKFKKDLIASSRQMLASISSKLNVEKFNKAHGKSNFPLE